MAVSKPFRRTVRQWTDGPYSEEGRSRYIDHPRFAEAREHYIRGFLLIQKDLQTLFDYVEPSDHNLHCHSFRIHELLLRTCVEVEANCKAEFPSTAEFGDPDARSGTTCQATGPARPAALHMKRGGD